METTEAQLRLEQAIHRELQTLPDLPAPRNLMPKVMETISKPLATAWWKCPWAEWPRTLQFISVGMLIGLFVLIGWAYGDFSAAARQHSHGTGGVLDFIEPVWTLTSAMLTALQAMLACLRPLGVVLVAATITALYVSAVILGTLIYRVGRDNNHISS